MNTTKNIIKLHIVFFEIILFYLVYVFEKKTNIYQL